MLRVGPWWVARLIFMSLEMFNLLCSFCLCVILLVIAFDDRQITHLICVRLKYLLYELSGPYRAMRAAMRCVLNTEMAMRCDAKWRCAFSLWKSSAMRSHDAKTLAMRCRDAGHSVYDFLGGCFGPSSCCFSYIKGQKHPLKKSYRKCLRRTLDE